MCSLLQVELLWDFSLIKYWENFPTLYDYLCCIFKEDFRSTFAIHSDLSVGSLELWVPDYNWASLPWVGEGGFKQDIFFLEAISDIKAPLSSDLIHEEFDNSLLSNISLSDESTITILFNTGCAVPEDTFQNHLPSWNLLNFFFLEIVTYKFRETAWITTHVDLLKAHESHNWHLV